MTTKFDELVAKLKEIFQIDKPELDFGIYKIVNAKADMIQKFLTNDLKSKVQAALADKSVAGKKALEEKIAKIEATLAPLGVQPSSSAEWVAAKAELDKLAASDDSESLVYAHLLTFFSRYYDDGDFISKRRYKEGQYAIPYSGEEVKLHWANADQYYTKSGENFTNYDFTVDGKKVHFKLVQAAVAKDNIKDNDCVRCFVLWNPEGADILSHAEAQRGGERRDDDGRVERADRVETGFEEEGVSSSSIAASPEDFLEVKDGELYIYFQYKKLPKGAKQKDFADAAYAAIQKKMTEDGLWDEYPIFKEAPTEADKHRTVLTREFTRYMAKNTSDYFIHKNLRKFLTQELDNYVKTEMMNLDDISNAATFDMIAANLRLIQTFRLIAMELIGFMAQLEDFQKKLWLKKKFVVQCDYCITMDRVPEELRAEVLANKAQQEEWERLGFGEMNLAAKNAKDAKGKQGEFDLGGSPSSATAIDARMVDTKFFDETFKAKLLRSIPDLDERCDGLLIHSENFGALNLLQERYREQVKCIYIDPPYNADATCILYKNGYRHSSWNSLIIDRLMCAKGLMTDGAICCTTIDDYELYNLKHLLDMCFEYEGFLSAVAIRNNPSGRSTVAGFAVCHEYGLFYGVGDAKIARMEHTEDQRGRYDCVDADGRHFEWENLRKSTADSYHEDRPKQFFPVYYSAKQNRVRVPKCNWQETNHAYEILDPLLEDEIECYPMDDQGRERVWAFGIERVRIESENGDIICKQRNGKLEFYKKKFLKEEGTLPRTWWDKPEYSARDSGSRELANLFGSNRGFDFPKAPDAVKDALKVANIGVDGLALDYFGGSGTTAHAVIDLNRQDGGKRKYILVEMGDHFDTVLMPRVKKVVYAPDWKDGKPVSTDKGISHCFKYMTLESYEDTLNNLKLEKPGELGVLQNEYMLNYMLEIESRKSLLGLDKFAHPFDYTLDLAVDSSGATKPQKVDMVETFNYLIGLRVQLVDRNISKGYVLVHGELPSGEEALVLWRDLGKVDNAELKKILDKQGIHPREKGFVLYVNGDHNLPNTVKEDGEEKIIKVRSIEADFNRLMFEEA